MFLKIVRVQSTDQSGIVEYQKAKTGNFAAAS